MDQFAIFGALVAWCLSLAALCLALSVAFSGAEKLFDKIVVRHEELIRKKVGNQVFNESHWLSEYPEARLTLEVLGKRLMQDGWYRPDNFRVEFEREKKRQSR